MAERGRAEAVRTYSRDAIVAQYEELCQRVVDESVNTDRLPARPRHLTGASTVTE